MLVGRDALIQGRSLVSSASLLCPPTLLLTSPAASCAATPHSDFAIVQRVSSNWISFSPRTDDPKCTLIHSNKEENSSLLHLNISYTAGPILANIFSDVAFATHPYKAKAAKAKTTDKAMAIEFTTDTEVEPGALPVLAAAGTLLVGLPLAAGFADPLALGLLAELLPLGVVLLLVAEPPEEGNCFFSGQLRS
jgi:hypothetical protein